jgi:DNA-binding protein HU-beta
VSISKKDLVKRVAHRVDNKQTMVEEIIDATLEEIYQSLKERESVNIRNFGTFYVKQHRDSVAFKFNPGQKLRMMLGWSSSYKGDV